MSSPATHNVLVTDSDHGAFIIITALLGVAWAVLMLGIRLYIRCRLNWPFGLDDVAASFATLVGVFQTCLTLIAVHNGIGKRQDLLVHAHLYTAMKAYYAGNLLYIVAICSSKCSMFLLIARLARQTLHLVACHALCGFTIIWRIAALFAISFQRSLPEPWNTENHDLCSSLFTRWVIVEAFSVFIEVFIPAMAITLVWGFSMAFKTKAMVVSAFSVQLLVVVPVVFRLIFVRRASDTMDVTFGATDSALATQVVMHFSIMAATFPCFRQFLQAFDSGLRATTKIGTEFGSGSRSQSGYVLESLDTVPNGSRRNSKAPQQGQLRPDSTQIVTEVTAHQRTSATGEGNNSVESIGSDRATIRKTQEWEVRYERREQGV